MQVGKKGTATFQCRFCHSSIDYIGNLSHSDRLLSAIVAISLLSSFLAATQAFAQEQIVIEMPSDQETFIVEIIWTSDDIGTTNTFDIHFIEPETGEEIEDVVYDFSIYNEGHREVIRRDQTATRQQFIFDQQGSYEIRIEDIDALGERVAIPIQVTPEFPITLLLAIAAMVLGAAMLVAKRNSNNLFRQQT